MITLHPEERKASKKKYWLILGFALLLFGTTVAARVTINGGNSFNFGQGVYQIKACDGWININLEKTATVDGVMYGGQRVQAVSAVNIDGLNTASCKGNNFKIKLFTTGNSTPLDLYTQDAASSASNQVWLSINKTTQVVSILNTSGVDLGEYGDDYVALGMDPDTHRYTVYFFYPLLAASRVNSITIESGPNA